MNPISDSRVKERMRIDNENQARIRENEIRSRLNNQVNALVKKQKFRGTPFVVGGLALGIILAIGGSGFTGVLIGFVLGLIVWGLANIYINSYNNNIEQKKQELKDQAEKEIKQVDADADVKTEKEIKQYDSEVKDYSEKVLQQGSKLDPMVQHVTDMFQRMVSHADTSSHLKFVEADLTYSVNLDGISFQYQSRYWNPQDDYNFNRERFRDLRSQAECEGLARALAKMTMRKMKALYPPNSISLSLTHIDAEVTLHFKGANANFVPAQNIV